MRESPSPINQPRLTNYHPVTHRVMAGVFIRSKCQYQLQPKHRHLRAATPSNTMCSIEASFLSFALCFTEAGGLRSCRSPCPNTRGVPELSRSTRQAAEYTQASRAQACKHALVCARGAGTQKGFIGMRLFTLCVTRAPSPTKEAKRGGGASRSFL